VECAQRFDREFRAIADPVWEEQYRRSPGISPGPMKRL
jgi:hypothetical protein